MISRLRSGPAQASMCRVASSASLPRKAGSSERARLALRTSWAEASASSPFFSHHRASCHWSSALAPVLLSGKARDLVAACAIQSPSLRVREDWSRGFSSLIAHRACN